MNSSDDLGRLEALLRDGLLTEEEFESAKRRLLAAAEDPAVREGSLAADTGAPSDNLPDAGGYAPRSARRVPVWGLVLAAAALVGVVFVATRESAEEQVEREVQEILAAFEADVDTCVLSIFAWLDAFAQDATFVGSALGFQTDEYRYVLETSSEARVIQFARGTEAAVAEVQPKVIDYCINNPEARDRFIRVRAPGF